MKSVMKKVKIVLMSMLVFAMAWLCDSAAGDNATPSKNAEPSQHGEVSTQKAKEN